MEFQREELDEILNIFQQESMEIIASMDEKLLILEKEGKNTEVAMQLFRDAHSLKGSARMLGFENIQNIAHRIEDIISLVREEKLVITPEINDIISESLEFISMLINKTVELKEEYVSLDIENHINRLKDVAENYKNFQVPEIKTEENNPEKELFLKNFEEIENIIVEILYIISYVRKFNDFNKLSELENCINKFILIISDINIKEISSLKNYAQNILNSLDKFKMSDNKQLAFLDINSLITSLVDNITNYTIKEHIERKDYFELVENKLNAINQTNSEKENISDTVNQSLPVFEEKKEAVDLEFQKLNEIIPKIPLLMINTSFLTEVHDEIEHLILTEDKPVKKELFIIIRDIIKIFKDKNIVPMHDVMQGIKEALETAKSNDIGLINEAIVKTNIIRTITKFQQQGKKGTNQKTNAAEISQKELLNTITNTEIKTLRVDSVKLDNLVGQIGELIVSKIKTNEHLSLAKQINTDLSEWQKNFVKMDYYIKYFDKKYLQNTINDEPYDIRKISAYNKQLSALSEQHTQKISEIIKEMAYLFKQLQESENKLNSTTNEIEAMVKNMRVLPLSTIFQLFPRMVHNIAREKNKKIEFSVEGADITADKTILEEIKTPLIHIIRNSIDHGIEDIETRKALGKNPIGKIQISASYKDTMIVIDIKDDGRGLDIEKIKSKALEKKLLTQEEINAISNEELMNLIFYPGFSTEDFVTELSGRGLGLDIVNNKINELNGRIDIFSELNKGTIVRIILPATIATKKVFIIEEQNQLYAIETSVIKTITRINPDEIFEKDNHNYYIYNGNAIAIYLLSDILNFKSDDIKKTKYTLLIIETDNITFGIIVEKLISDQEIVHKKLAPPLYKIKNISGITTLANGEACLILNIGDIISTITSKKMSEKISPHINIDMVIKDNSKYKILVVDDSYTTRTLQKNILTNNGYTVTTSGNPNDALEKIKETNFDFIISDVQMPNMNGFEFISKLRENQNYENIPVMVISSEPHELYKKEIKEAKIITYIQKNLFNQDEYLKIIKKYLDY